MEQLRRRPLTWFPLWLVVLGGCPAPSPDGYSARVVGVADGDTIEVAHSGQSWRIRLHGIDCPERRQDFGEVARRFTADLAFGQTVQVRPIDRDRYGRVVAVVVLADGRVLNHELVRAGLAWWYRRYAPNDRALAALERAARRRRVGLWSRPEPVPPWEWRQPANSR